MGKSTKIFFVYISDQQEDVVMTKHGDTFDLVGLVDIGEEELALRTLMSSNEWQQLQQFIDL